MSSPKHIFGIPDDLPGVAFTWHELVSATQALPPAHKQTAMPGSITARQRDAIRARQMGNRVSGYPALDVWQEAPCWFCAHPFEWTATSDTPQETRRQQWRESKRRCAARRRAADAAAVGQPGAGGQEPASDVA